LPFAASYGDNGILERSVRMKSMKLYTNVHRIHNELAALGIARDAALRVDQLTPFDQYHYFGTDAVDEALEVLQLQPGSRVLDVGSGIGGPARYIAAKTGAHVTALEFSPIFTVARGLTARCGYPPVEHVCNILNGAVGGLRAIISFLCFLHPRPEKNFRLPRRPSPKASCISRTMAARAFSDEKKPCWSRSVPGNSIPASMSQPWRRAYGGHG
jgi:SAM-dependent methyltransferase